MDDQSNTNHDGYVPVEAMLPTAVLKAQRYISCVCSSAEKIG